MAAYKDEARGTWYVSFHYNDWTGKNKRKLKRGFRTRKEALEYEQKFLLQQATNLDMRFADFYKLYEEDLKPKLKLNTWRTKDVIFQKKLIPYFKDKKMNEISPADIIKWQNEMIKKRQADGKPYKPTYLKTMQSELSAIFNHAVRFYNLRENPVKKAGTIGKGKADEMDFWTKEEYLKFIECVKDKPISYYAFQILYWCGIREGDADGKISLNQQKPSKHAGLRRFGPEKFLQRNNEFMKERPIFYKKPIKTEKDFSTWLRCFYYTTKAVITEYIYF